MTAKNVLSLDGLGHFLFVFGATGRKVEMGTVPTLLGGWGLNYVTSPFSSQMYETDLWKFSVPKSKSPVFLDYFYLLWPLETVIKVTLSHN